MDLNRPAGCSGLSIHKAGTHATKYIRLSEWKREGTGAAISSYDHRSPTREEKDIRSIRAANGIAPHRDARVGATSLGSAATRPTERTPS